MKGLHNAVFIRDTKVHSYLCLVHLCKSELPLCKKWLGRGSSFAFSFYALLILMTANSVHSLNVFVRI